MVWPRFHKPARGNQPPMANYNHHHNYGRCCQKCPPTAAHKVQFWVLARRINRGRSLNKQICFSLAMRGSTALKTLWWWGNDGDESCLAIRTFWGSKTLLLQEKSISACSGDCLLSIQRIGAGWATFCVLLGGRFRQRQPWWWRLLLAVGHWLLRAYVRTNPTVEIVKNYLRNAFFCLKYLSWFKFYLQCPDIKSKIYSIS